MATIRYFAYGSNMLTEQLHTRCPSAEARAVAYASDWVLTFSKRSQDGSGKATISPCMGRRVIGVVFDLNKNELSALDRAEHGYERKDEFIVCIDGSHEALSVVTYIALPSHIDTALKPFGWYLTLVLTGARHHALPPDYISALENISSIVDLEANRPSRLEALALLEHINP